MLFSCKKEIHEDITPIVPPSTGVNVNLNAAPFSKLSEYRFFVGPLSNQAPNEGVILYEPASQLFTDYAKKKRFIWVPPGSKMNYVADGELFDMPVGTVLIKSFYYDEMLPSGAPKILETRIMIKKASGWIFGEYVWNESQTEATLNMNGANIPIQWMQEGQQMATTYRIPSETECLICHKDNQAAIPIGLKPQNLNNELDYGSEASNQLVKLIQVGYLHDNLPGNILSTVNYLDATKSLDERFRSYLDINCAHCHRLGSHCDYRPLRLAFSETANTQNIGVCVEPEEFIDPTLLYIVSPSNIVRSMMYFRVNSTDENIRMPLLGRSIIHTEGVELIEQWINSTTEICN